MHTGRTETRERVTAPRGAHTRTLAQCPPARYEPYLDGLFTYCLSGAVCHHDEATAALGDALALAERRGHRGPVSADDRRAWLYALAGWSCLRKLTEARRRRQVAHASGRRAPAKGHKALFKGHREAADRHAAEALSTPVSEEAQDRRRHELALLAWPEAAGTTPEQREALELAVRHQLAAAEVAAVLGLDLVKARELLATAACEVERTRAALAVVETGTCPSVGRLTGDNQLVLSTTLRRELVRHVDDCPRCRRTAERAAPGAWPGTTVTPAALPVLEAPRAALHIAMAHVPRDGAAPRFDRRGFPVDPKDHAARRDRLRARAVTTTVVATVVAAPVLALGRPTVASPRREGADGRSITASEAHGSDGITGEEASGYENAGNAGARADARFTKGNRSPDVSVEVISAPSAEAAPGHLSVRASGSGDTTLVTLAASGNSPVHWSAGTGASWLTFSQSSGTLAPGETFTIKVYVDHLREPVGPWARGWRSHRRERWSRLSGRNSGSARPGRLRPDAWLSYRSPPARPRPPRTRRRRPATPSRRPRTPRPRPLRRSRRGRRARRTRAVRRRRPATASAPTPSS